MIKKILITALICLLCISVFVACTKKVTEEEILPEKLVTISTVSELVDMQNYTGIKYSKYTFQLQNDIDLSNIDIWEPIGKDITSAFMGKFDGQGHKISNLSLKGWESNGNPIFVGKDSLVINETSYCSIGLFGYTKNTEIIDLSLTNVNIFYYTEGIASYTAALVGFDAGSSKFSNISADGNIKLANTYTKVKTFDNKGIEQGTKDVCQTVQYIAGVVAYSSGSGVFNNINSSVMLQNAMFKAIYREADEENNITEGYSIRTDDDKSVLVEQAICGGVFGLVRGATINNVTSSAQMRIKAKSSYVGGIAAALYNSTAKNANATDVNICGKVATKNTVGGAVALLDHSSYTDSTLSNITIDEQCQANEVQAASVGGAVGYAYDGSVIENIAIDKLSINSMYSKSTLGGILGIVRDSTLKNSSIAEGKFTANSLNKNDTVDEYDKFFASCAVLVGAIYGNSLVADCVGEVKNKYTYYYREGEEDVLFDKFIYNTVPYGIKDSISYVNEDGFASIRLFKEGSLTEYIVAYATYNAGSLNVIFYTEESKILSEQSYGDVDEVLGSDCDGVKYKDVFFTQGEGIKDANGNIINFENRETTKYVYLSGIPSVDDDSLRIIVIK